MDSPEPDTHKLPLGSLQGEHHEILTRAIANVISSPIAEITYAQIVDGLPLADVAIDTYQGVLEKTRTLRSHFDADHIEFDFKLLHAFRAAAPSSRAFDTRLIELVAVAIHRIAAWLQTQDHVLGPDDPLVSWRPSDEHLVRLYPNGYPPALFWHPWYQAYERYPDGVADMVGYWAESRIFGGVVLFDRRKPGSAPDVDPDAIYLHADRRNVTYRIYRLLDSQKHAILQFLLSENGQRDCPLPILGDLSNRQRVDPEEPLEETGIYRDTWERSPLRKEGVLDRRLKDVVDTFNYISRDDWAEACYRGMDARQKRFREMQVSDSEEDD